MTNRIEEDDWMSVEEVAEELRVSTFVVRSVIKAQTLPAIKFGRAWRIRRSDLARITVTEVPT